MLKYFNQKTFDVSKLLCPYCQRPMKTEVDFLDVDFTDIVGICGICSIKWAKTGAPSIDAFIWKEEDKSLLYKLSLYVGNVRVDFISNVNGSSRTEFFLSSSSEEAYNGFILYLEIDEDIEFDGMDKETLLKQISFYLTYG